MKKESNDMKRRTSKLLSILLALCMALALLPGTALADGWNIKSYDELVKELDRRDHLLG